MSGAGFVTRAMTALRDRWPEWRAAIAWIVSSWRRPGGAEARWEQGRDHDR